jgi:hypothetical protein
MKKIVITLLVFICHLLSTSTLFGSPELVYSTYFGSRGDDNQSGLYVDESGILHFTGITVSTGFPVTDDAYDKTYNGGNNWGTEDLVIVQFDIERNALSYSSYFGGRRGPEFPEQVLFRDNKLYIVGGTGSSDFPVSGNAYDPTFNGPVFRHADGFLSCFSGNELAYSTYIGTSGNEGFSNIFVEDNGEMIVVGGLAKPDEMVITHRFSQESLPDNPNACVMRFNAAGETLLSSTLLGPVWSLTAVRDGEGYIYLTGSTPSPNFPVTPEAYDTSYNGGSNYWEGDIFVTKLSPTGDDIIFSTFLGGGGEDSWPQLCLDQDNNIIVFGNTRSLDFPVTEDAVDSLFESHSKMFVAKLNNDGRQLLYASLLGGTCKSENGESSGNVIVSDAGDIYLFGRTDAEDYPVTHDAMNATHIGEIDIFITVLDSTLANIKYSTYLGGTSDEWNASACVDRDGNIVGICSTESPDFPTTPYAYNRRKNGGWDMAIFKISPIEPAQMEE